MLFGPPGFEARVEKRHGCSNTDVILQLDQTVAISRFVLSQLSPVLGEFLDCATKEQVAVPLPPVTLKVEQHQPALREILSNVQLRVTVNSDMIRADNVIALLEAAIYADIKQVIEDCVDWLRQDLENSCGFGRPYCPYRLWEMACRCNLVHLQDSLVSNVQWSLHPPPSSLATCWTKLIENLSTEKYQSTKKVLKRKGIDGSKRSTKRLNHSSFGSRSQNSSSEFNIRDGNDGNDGGFSFGGDESHDWGFRDLSRDYT